MLASVTAPVLDVEPACPGAGFESHRQRIDVPALVAERRAFGSIDRRTWDVLAAANPWATSFSTWGFHRAWWDAYGATAHDQTLVIRAAGLSAADQPVAIVPLMHRHEVEPTDAATHTTMRHGSGASLTPVEPHAKAVFFGASYHADYATVLAAPAHLPAVAEAVAEHLAAGPSDPDHPEPWDVIDLRRLRCGDPAADALAEALGRREMSHGWTLNVEREDVCPVLILPVKATFDDYLGTLGKKERHEVRRKLRRAETVGDVTLAESPSPLDDLDAFIDLHQKRWGDDGLFAPTPGGAASRVFFRRLFEEAGPACRIGLTFLTVGARRVAAGVHCETSDGYLYYNAGTDPDARDLSPGVLMIARYVERALGAGKRRFDFLRGNEPYKYEWGAVDEPIQRLLVRRGAGR
jgi:CelD/BcsL family acetyltransferase involved in cellulose biosynthesis